MHESHGYDANEKNKRPHIVPEVLDLWGSDWIARVVPAQVFSIARTLQWTLVPNRITYGFKVMAGISQVF